MGVVFVDMRTGSPGRCDKRTNAEYVVPQDPIYVILNVGVSF